MDNDSSIYYNILQDSIIDLDSIRLLAFKHGVPNNNKLRAKLWKLLLGYYPKEQQQWSKVDDDCLQQYLYYQQLYLSSTPPTELPSFQLSSNSTQTNGVELKEVPTPPPHLLRTNFGDKKDYNTALQRILYIFHISPDGISYVQGFNIIANTLYHVFVDASDSATLQQAEVATYFCMVKLLNNIRNWYNASYDMKETGIRAAMGRVMWLVKQKNNRLAESLNSIVDPGLYLFRWLTLLGSFELPMNVTICMWDRMFCDLFLAAMLLEVECYVGSFEDTLKMLQSYPVHDFFRIHFTACDILRDVMRVNPARVLIIDTPIGKDSNICSNEKKKIKILHRIG
ncbi:Rab-GAP TBC domain-containing protein [Entamoeba marina]